MDKNNFQLNRELIAQIAEGDERAFALLFDHYYDWFYGRAYRLSESHFFCEELVQEVFMEIWKNRRFLLNAEDPDAYLFKMFYRQLHHRLREEAKEKKLKNAVLDMPVNEDLADDDMELLQRRADMLQSALSEFPAQQAAVFRLIKEEGMSREAVARHLGISPNTVRNHLAEAVKRLRQLARNLPFWCCFF